MLFTETVYCNFKRDHSRANSLNLNLIYITLRLFGEAHQILQTWFAALLEVDPRMYNRWERGTATPQFDTVVRIADILQQVSLDELAGRSASINDPKIHNTELSSIPCEK